MMIRIENQTKGTTLMAAGRRADHFFSRLRGLMGVRHLPPGDGLLIAGTNCIHTHFMAIPIDVVYLDAALCVVDMEANMFPWRFGRLRRQARAVLELPVGTIEQSALAVGDQLLLQEEPATVPVP